MMYPPAHRTCRQRSPGWCSYERVCDAIGNTVPPSERVCDSELVKPQSRGDVPVEDPRVESVTSPIGASS